MARTLPVGGLIMGRPLRWLRPDTLWYVTNRCYQRRFLLRPDAQANLVVLRALARALERHGGVRLHAAVTVSNHFHLLVSDATSALSAFMRELETAVAKGLNELRDREGHVFDRRYSAEPVLDTAAAIGRVLYTVLNPIEAGLVARHEDWPGVLLYARGAEIERHVVRWFDERRYQKAVRAAGGDRSEVDREGFWEQRTIPVHPLDGLAKENVTPGDLVDRIRAGEAACARRRDGRPVLGAATVVRQDPRAKPKRSNRSPRPLCHASSYADYRSFRGVFRAFCRLFWSASDSLRNGDGSQRFPAYSFPPWKPLVLPALSTA